MEPKEVIDSFHKLYYENPQQTWTKTYWFGIPCLKCPLDLWIYQEILAETAPELIIECGSALGGSALYLAMLCDLMNHGRVLTIDVEVKPRPIHPRIEYVYGSSIDSHVIYHVTKKAREATRTMVILDSLHIMDHVYAELQAYSRVVTQGCYLIVEDTNVNGHPVYPDHGPGPSEALAKFLDKNTDFIQDRSREKFFMTWNPGGYLKRITPRS